MNNIPFVIEMIDGDYFQRLFMLKKFISKVFFTFIVIRRKK